MEAEKLDERWTPTSIHATFAVHQLPPCTTRSRAISIYLPFLKFGWSFALNLAPERISSSRRQFGRLRTCNWITTAFSFRRDDDHIPWGDTSMHVQFALTTEEATSHGDNPTSTSLLDTTFTTALTNTQFPLATTCTLSPHRSIKIGLSVTISQCPFAKGLFHATSIYGDEREAHTRLIRQSGDRVLSRSLATGKLFDVKFLCFSANPTSSEARKVAAAYASLAVLENHLKLPDSKLKDGWANALKALNDDDNADPIQVSCPDEYEHELDSDFEDEDQVSSPAELDVLAPHGESNLVITIEAKQPRCTTASSGSWTSAEADRASDQGSTDIPQKEFSDEPSHLFSEPTTDCQRTILVKFAAYRTWHSFLWYCYTGQVEFNKLRSQGELDARPPCVTRPEGSPPSCSPKSMYRLADLVGDNDLKAKSLQAISERMTEANILDETFSVFTSKYPDVRDAQLDVFLEHCKSPTVKAAFLRTMQTYGNMPHAAPVLSAFYDYLVA